MQNFKFYSKDNVKKSLENLLIFLLFLFQFFGVGIAILSNKDLSVNMIYLAISFVVISTIYNIAFKKIIGGERPFILLVTFLYTISVIMMLRLDQAVARNHIYWYILGILAFTIVFHLYRYIDKMIQDKFYLFLGLTILTFLVTLGFGITQGGAKNWIIIGGLFTIQLSEFAKITYILLIASYYKNLDKFRDMKFGKYYLVFSSYIFSMLFFFQGELGTAVLFAALLICSIFIFERRYFFIFSNIALALVGIYLASFVLAHIKVRIDIWLDPWSDYNNRGYQVIQGLFSIANGGFFGAGVGLGSPTLVPVVHSDYILAAIIEEMGIFMGFVIILIYVLIFYRTVKMALQFNSNFYSSVSISIGLLYSFQALIMFGGILKLIPLTGITTPFLSYGGSSTLSNFILLAILQNITTKLGENYEQFKE